MAALWPQVQSQLVALLPTLPALAGVPVYDGPPLADEAPKDFVVVGAGNGTDVGGGYVQSPGPVDGMTEETGVVLCEFVSWSGDEVLSAVRSRVFGFVNALEASLLADQTLGLFAQGATTTLSAEVLPQQNTSGAEQRLVVSVHYFARH